MVSGKMPFLDGCPTCVGRPIIRLYTTMLLSVGFSLIWTDVRRPLDIRRIGCPDPAGCPIPVKLPTGWAVRLAVIALQARTSVGERTSDGSISDIRFPPDVRHLCSQTAPTATLVVGLYKPHPHLGFGLTTSFQTIIRTQVLPLTLTCTKS